MSQEYILHDQTSSAIRGFLHKETRSGTSTYLVSLFYLYFDFPFGRCQEIHYFYSL
jgi:hypothetical protein